MTQPVVEFEPIAFAWMFNLTVSIETLVYQRIVSAFRDRGVPEPTSECAACPSPDGSSAGASAKGGVRESEVGGRSRVERERERERDGGSRDLRVRPAPRSGALAVGGYKRPHG